MGKRGIVQRIVKKERIASKLRDIILGGQDGIVNILGLVLGVAEATTSIKIVLISGLASTFAESISMAAVAYTSTKAAREYYESELEKQSKEITKKPSKKRKEIAFLYRREGFSGKLLSLIVRKVTGNKDTWLSTLMAEKIQLQQEHDTPLQAASIVGFSSLIGSLIPLLPFFMFPLEQSIPAAVIFSVLILFLTGALKAKLTVGDWKRSGIEMAIIGALAAVAGYAIGVLLGKL